MNRIIKAAYALASSRQMCSVGDLDLIIETVGALPAGPRVIQLGAGSGTMALAIVGARRDVDLWTIDNDPKNLGWESQALQNAGHRPGFCYTQVLADSGAYGRRWDGGRLGLLVVDADHSYSGARRDLRAWGQWADTIICHDYDGTTAPHQYPGVARACLEYFSRDPDQVRGWSGLWRQTP